MSVYLKTLATLAVGLMIEGLVKEEWKSAGFYLSLCLPALLMPVAVCLLFVPRSFGWSNAELHYWSRFGRNRVLPWAKLRAFGNGNQVFAIEFAEIGTFQIYPGAFAIGEWKAFRSFLEETFPEKKVSWRFGSHSFIRGGRRD